MKRLLILTVLATLLSTSSGCRMWNNWFHRGDACDPCLGMGSSCGSGAVVSGVPSSTYIPSVSGTGTTHILPGPRMESVPAG